MYVNRLRLLNVKSVQGAIPENGQGLPERARKRLLIQGANGSGKSTILETILTLWKFWGEWLDEGPTSVPPEEHLVHFLNRVDFAAVEFAGLPDSRSLWIAMGKRFEWNALRNSVHIDGYAGVFKDNLKIELEEDPWLDLRRRSLAGSVDFPNIVYFPPEYRTLRDTLEPARLIHDGSGKPVYGGSGQLVYGNDSRRGGIIGTTHYNWTAVFDSNENLDSILLTVKALNEERFAGCLRLVNMALKHKNKQITGFGPKGLLMITGKTVANVPFQHGIEELSSGEKQILLQIAFIAAFLRPGGIVLLDEPDLHIHISMISQLLETVEHIVRERNGQLIVASHSPCVWDWFVREDERLELSPWRPDKA